MENEEKKYIYHPESKIEDDTITIYGAGKFGEEKLVLNRERATMVFIDLHKFLINKQSKG